jgi:hypothetical protein
MLRSELYHCHEFVKTIGDLGRPQAHRSNRNSSSAGA